MSVHVVALSEDEQELPVDSAFFIGAQLDALPRAFHCIAGARFECDNQIVHVADYRVLNDP
ncbi:hypothetical protein [Acrocarpospora sp. B8E8]|uniref:hypothetical protein n=1 Tax=Acrocarpospora sp. B8E8 TaxID=3153572 RepID=UPI00325DC49D